MTHNITGSEVGADRAPTYLREIKPRRPITIWMLAPFVVPLAVPIYLIDQLIGFPLCVLMIVAAFLAWVFKPERR